jgi:hypothetical protein
MAASSAQARGQGKRRSEERQLEQKREEAGWEARPSWEDSAPDDIPF